MYKIGTKIVATILVMIMTLANIASVGVYAVEANLEKQSTQTNHTNVYFDAYFVENEKQVHEAVKKIGEVFNLYAKVSVAEAGYLKNAKIQIKDAQAEEANFVIGNMEKKDKVQTATKTEVTLNQINKGSESIIEIPVEFPMADKIDISNFEKENIVILTGTYVDSNGKEVKIEKEIHLKLAWTNTQELVVEQQVSKYIPYQINQKAGIILQTILKTNMKDNALPTKQTQIQIQVPIIDGIAPEEVKVVSNSTNATNGEEEAVHFTKENYIYDAESKMLNITVKNEPDENGQVAWKKQAQDEFLVTYVYPKEVLSKIGKGGTEVTLNAKVEVEAYHYKATKIEAQVEDKVTLKEQISQIISFEITNHTQKISKGYIYANTKAAQKIETNYDETIAVNIGLAELTDKIVFTQKAETFVQKEGNSKGSTTVSGNHYAYYKTVTISKAQFIKLFGEEGTLQFYKGDTVIATINKDTKVDENGNYIIDISQADCNELKIETSKPIVEGKLEMHMTKAIKGDMAYSKEQMRSFDGLLFEAIGEAYSGDTKFVEQTLENTIDMTEPETKADIVINKESLSTVVTNQNVEIKAILRTDSIDNNLFTNPTIEIILPAYIESIQVKDVKVLFDEELQIKTATLVQNADGTKSIILTLEGEQTKYSIGSVSGGTNIIITADITVNKLTPNKEAQIIMNYTNHNVSTKTRSAAEQKQTSATINFVAPTGVITTNSISNYAEGKDTLTSISGEEQTGVIETIADARNVNFAMSVINNYNNVINNIQVLGRIPSKGNKTILTSQDLSSTMNMLLQSVVQVEGIDTSKVMIYYSENGQATKDLSNSSNGWTTAPSNLANVKSYLIVVSDYIMNTGDSFNFHYTAQIPANLQHNENAYETYAVYFDNHLAAGTIQDKTEAAKVGVTTGKGAVLEASMSSNINENTPVLEGSIIKYTINVKNIGTEVAKNVKTTTNIPSCMQYVEKDETSTLGYKYVNSETVECILGDIKAGETVSKEIWVKVERLTLNDICKDETHFKTNPNGQKVHLATYTHEESEYTAKIELMTAVSADNLAKPIESTKVTNTVTRAYFKTTPNGRVESGSYLKEGVKYIYTLNMTSTNKQKERENTTVTIQLPKELKYESLKILQYNSETSKEEDKTSEAKIEYDASTNMLIIYIGSLNAYYGKTIELVAITQALEDGVYEKQVEVNANIKADDTPTELIQSVSENINKPGVRITQTSNIPEKTKIATEEDYKYVFSVRNLSKMNLDRITFTDILPEEVNYINAKVIYTDGTTKNYSSKNSEGNPEFIINLPAGETAQIEVNVKAGIVENDTTIVNVAKLKQDEIDEIQSNKITHIIEAYSGQVDPNPDNTTKRISGLVWMDTNKNGMREEDEELVSDVPVMLLNNNTGTLVTDTQGNVIIQKTSKEGIYTFSEVGQGKYTVIFLYDTANYSATTYQKADVDASMNSDAVDTKITLDGVTRVAAITEEVSVMNSNIYNIDLGLVSNPKFDLKLDKTVSKITVQNPTGTAEYPYNDSKLAKRDLIGKYVNQTTLVIEYKIKVTNEGAVEGYVKKIADYIPTGLKFNAELNRDWYSSQNGMLLNSSLANTKIAPGESKEVTLLLTMKVSEDNLGIINNSAEIYEAYNDLGLEDIDSTPGNKASNEDDMSSADVLITIRTGKTIMFIGITTVIVAIIGVGAYFIKKKVLR
ncbi:MAG: SdrD B-like domain-containing protein [Clostridia bacterium]